MRGADDERIPNSLIERPEFIRACSDRDMAQVFKLARKYAGLTNNAIGRMTGLGGNRVGELINGKRYEITKISLIEDIADGLGIPGVMLGLAPRSWEQSQQAVTTALPALLVGTPEAQTIQVSVRVDGRDVVVAIDRRTLLQTGLGSMLEAFMLGNQLDVLSEAAAQRDLSKRLEFASPAHIGEVLSHLKEQWHELVKTDNLLGPRHALLAVRSQITVLETLLRDARQPARIETVRLAAQYAESAAWLHEDSGDMARARYWASQAMEWAYESGDHTMLAWTVFRRSQQAAAVSNPAQAIGLARAARRDEEQLPRPMRAAIRVQEAHGHAMDGNELMSQQLLDEAHDWAAGDTAGDARGGHGSFCTASYIEIHRAGCWLNLGQPKRAISLYEAALPALPSVYQRDRAAALGKMAAAYAADGQPEHAAATAQSALPLARMTGSRRVLDGIQGVGVTLSPHRELPSVAQLIDDLSSDME